MAINPTVLVENSLKNVPNILYLHSHDTGRYIQPYGEQVPMPNVQVLADQGVLFRQAFCAAPTCSASRACLLTGQYSQTPPNLPDAPEVRADVAAFKASARSLDHGVGMVLNALDNSALADDTLVIFT